MLIGTTNEILAAFNAKKTIVAYHYTKQTSICDIDAGKSAGFGFLFYAFTETQKFSTKVTIDRNNNVSKIDNI